MHIVSALRDTPTVSPHWELHNKAADEIERLREALREIHELGDTPDDSWKAYQICCKALGEKE